MLQPGLRNLESHVVKLFVDAGKNYKNKSFVHTIIL